MSEATETSRIEHLAADDLRLLVRICADQARKAQEQLERALEGRDNAIRTALAKGSSVADLMEDSGASRARIYQIRDERR